MKNTRSIQIVDPHWNKNRIEQVIGRGIRYKSHDALPKRERKVEVIHYQSTLPKSLMQKILKKVPDTSSDQYLDTFSQKKQDIIDKFLQVLKDEGSGR